ncbi:MULTISPECIES: MBL fold metallo-hydrolase [unclassified Arthrobacter]|uniref:MBL fold metallo-hydrolase n=1 Tax=unclassified Arthrobacter TaxID=235627 RepID=UPI002E00132C|nr:MULTISPECIES: MBL fold metallo-hydrolase [unclassified Arthrobacter]MEC5192136.1 glyoxylase-like metal-dependent hydrolase (beta-lactamase superfamily II) [Arthrobacter sp. MP_M4]MEC5203257.1 glyoxylase-like metal-dependent hydrolase (beta-lactamase superfamily II) [Arthrobacter sp. MP_M7]
MSAGSAGGLRIDRLVTSGTFSLDGGTWDVENNVWIVGDDAECIVIDPAHDAAAVETAVSGRKVTAILLTHGHDDHIAAVGGFRGRVNAPVYLNRADWMLWEAVFPGTEPDHAIGDGDSFDVAGVRLVALHTPGHSPGSMCFLLESEGTVFSGDTLFQGGPGATGRSYSDFPTIIESIKGRLLTLPADTVVRTGHGDPTTVGAEAPHLGEWITRGH